MMTNDANFFADEHPEERPMFGLIEEHDGSPCRCSGTEEDKWNAEIDNLQGCLLYFNPVDHHIASATEYPDNGRDRKRCDALLHSTTALVFVELKDVKAKDRKNARKKAVAQLLSTVRDYQSSISGRKFPEQYAAICFRRPQVSLNASVSSASSKEQLSEMGFKLVTGFRIIFDHAGSVQVKEAPESK